MDFLIWASILGILVFAVWLNDQFKTFWEKKASQEREKWELEKKRQNEMWEEHVQEIKEELNIIAAEKAIGFPWLANAFAEYFYLVDLKRADYLASKSHPAKSTAEQIRKEISIERRAAERAMRIYKYQLDYYEQMFPWLTEFREIDDEDLLQVVATDTGDDATDPVSRYLSPGEYSSLSREEKFQRALDRYWQSHKTKWQIGRDYERYVGYLYEKEGWDVAYYGIKEGLSDFGRDLIVTSGDQVKIVQCKCWAKHKLIHEKHIFQLFGSTVEYWITTLGRNVGGVQQLLFEDSISENPVKAVLYTSTFLSEDAKKFAGVLGVEFRENVQLVRYPSIKCNASKIYHLPFDQQYDRTKIQDARTEKYVSTIQEAEALGYRRAYRWRGPGDS